MATAYVDYTFYNATYLGTAIPQASFARIALRAAEILDRLTFRRAEDDTTNTTAIKNASCAIAEVFYEIELSGGVGGSGIQSEKVGQHSVTYSGSAEALKPPMQRYLNAAATFLAGTNLLYQGFLDDEYGTSIDEE